MKQIFLIFAFSILLFSKGWSQTPVVLDPPTWTVPGINYVDDNTVILQLWAPNKDYVYALGDFNNWQQDANHLMYKSVDGNTHWIQLNGLTPAQEYRFQFHVYPDNIRIADWYADKILDPWNDQWLTPQDYPGLIAFPSANASDPVSVFQTAQPNYNWTDSGFLRPAQNRLNVYELLVRDFSNASDYNEVINQLDYLQNLGINTLELMPVSEFEGNESWGYNPSFYFAPDKYYGPKNEFKRLVNECHQRGIAVVMDMALNHSFGLNPMVRLYYDGVGYVPTIDNPWFNTVATHDLSPGYDFNHESPHTRTFCKRVLEYWLQEYHVDGFRMDLSKGFTQTNSLGNLGLWNSYDQSRINILADYYGHVNWISPGAYFILEHFSDNSEETVLANMGMMLWGDMSFEYGEVEMGYSADLSWASYQSRGWTYQNLISFAESHDQERLMFNALSYGNAVPGYDVKNLNTALSRMEATHAFLFGIPGPKMIWQFGELGYDESINLCGDGISYSNSCRVDNKPTHWEYLNVPERRRLFKVMRALMWLRRNHDAFATGNFNLDVWGYAKAIRLYDPTMNVVIIGNFDVVNQSIIPGFPHAGTWYDYFTGAAFTENNLSNPYSLAPGEYHLYTDQPLAVPDVDGNTPIATGGEGCTDAVAANYNPLATIDDGTCQYQITLQVDMSNEAVSPLGVHVAGSFQGWNPLSTPMTDLGNGIWEYSFLATDGDQLLYKFINGNDWLYQESVSQVCGMEDGFGGYNRLWVVTTNETLPTYCFGLCSACVSSQVSLTIQVNMQNEVVSPLGVVHLAGSFQGWAPGLTAMTDLGNGVWEFVGTFNVGEYIEYKFINGNAWGMDESVPAACAVGLNRYHTVGAADEVLSPVCYATCNVCLPPGIPGCMDPTACNFDPSATVDNGSCDYSCLGCTNVLACNYNPLATINDGSCDFVSCLGCTDPTACNFDPTATQDNGSCDFSCYGCTDTTACNFNPVATVDDGTCDYSCLYGCTYSLATNFSNTAIYDDGSCVFDAVFCGSGTVWDAATSTCISVGNCPSDLNGDAVVNTADLLLFLGQFGLPCN